MNKVIIKPLGAGNEVGRSCIHVTHGDTQLLLDCGVHPAYTGIASLPFLDLIDLSKIDAILVTHFHLDHAAALPFITEKTEFKGKVYMTHPTKAILKWLLNDYIRVINSTSDTDFYSEADLERCYSRITPIDYHQTITIGCFQVMALNAGHVLGAAMFLLKLESATLLYTGDFSREEDRHLRAAESPGIKIDALITESTYGVQCHMGRVEREARFTKTVTSIVKRGGKCLLPVFALGRAQELLLILEEHWAANRELHSVPIYYVSALARRCMSVYQTYINMMNERIQKLSLTKNPFDFSYISSARDISDIRTANTPCVVMASPGMLQSGMSRELFERWCEDNRNGVIIPGYSVEGTLAKEILSEPKEVESMRGGMLRLNMTVEYISFSAHVDYTQNAQFIEECAPSSLFFVHGEMNEMQRLKNAISAINDKKGISMALFTLRNGEEGFFEVQREDRGRIYTDKPLFNGIIVQSKETCIYEADCAFQKDELKMVKLLQREAVTFNGSSTLIRHILMSEFDAVVVFATAREDEVHHSPHEHLHESISTEAEIVESPNASASIEGAPQIRLRVGGITVDIFERKLLMEWEACYLDDVLAMSINQSIKDIGISMKTVKLCKMDLFDMMHSSLLDYFIDVVKHEEATESQEGSGCSHASKRHKADNIVVSWKNKSATVFPDGSVIGSDEYLVGRVKEICTRIVSIFG